MDKKTALEDLIQFLRFKSVSTQSDHNQDSADCAEWASRFLKESGLQSEVYPTPGHPIVFAQTKQDPEKKTLLIYGHYDVQPVDPIELWDSDPFEPKVEGEYIYARGATDNKGQIMAHMQAIREVLKKGDCPLNVKFLIEGEEEIGSPNLKPFIEKNRELLECDVIAVSDTGMVRRGQPTFTYGLRGIACAEVFLKGPGMDLHSGIFGGAICNPITEAARLIGLIHDKNGNVQIPNFYKGVAETQDWELKQWKELEVAEGELKDICQVKALWPQSSQFTHLERMRIRPTAEINGFGGGYQGEVSKTIIPSEANFKVSFRLVPGQDANEILSNFKSFLEENVSSGVDLKVELGHQGKAYYMDPFSKFGKAAQNALEKTFGKGTALIREGGSVPIVQDFKDVLDVDTLLLGLALPDCRMHSPNENFLLENYYYGIEMSQNLIEELA